jgi:GT2 family glycosyltransferase
MQQRDKPSLVQRIKRWLGVFRYGLPRDFDRAEYLSLNPDVANVDPVQHFLEFGRKEGRSWRRGIPRGFDPTEYLSLNPDVANANVDPVQHFLEFGRKEGRSWRRGIPRGFDPTEYLSLNPDVANANADPVQHFLEFGRKEGRIWKRFSSAVSDSAAHLDQNSDDSAAVLQPDIHWEGGAFISDPVVVASHGNINIVSYTNRYWAVPQALGPVDFRSEEGRSHPAIISAKTHDQLIALLGEPVIVPELAANEDSGSRQDMLSPLLDPPVPTVLTPDALHEYAKIVGTRKLFSVAIPYFREDTTVAQGLQALGNIAGQPQHRSATPLPEPANECRTTKDEDNIRHPDSLPIQPGPSFPASVGETHRLRAKIPLMPQSEIIEHKYAKVIGVAKLISVVIPYFRKSSTVLRCLEALRDQEYELCGRDDIEIIIVDDGTPGERIHERLPEDVHYVWQKKIGFGGCRARNTGAKICNGRYIAFVDPDVIVERRYFDSILRGFSKFGDRIVQAGYIFGYFFDGCPDPRTEFGVWENPELLTRRFYQVASGNMAIARDLFNETPGFDEDLIYGGVEDLLFGYHVGLIPGTAIVFNREMEVHHIPHPAGSAHLNERRTWEIVKCKWPEFYTDYFESGSR